MSRTTRLAVALSLIVLPVHAAEQDYTIALKVYRLFAPPSGTLIEKALESQSEEVSIPSYRKPSGEPVRNVVPADALAPPPQAFLSIFEDEVAEGDLTVGTSNLLVEGERLEWVNKPGSQNAATALLYETYDAENKAAITIQDELPVQFFEAREDGAYALREADRLQGVSVTPRLRLDDNGAYTGILLWMVFDFMLGREPLDGVRLEVGPPIFSNPSAPSPTWTNVVVSPREDTWGGVLLGLSNQTGVPAYSLLVCVKVTRTSETISNVKPAPSSSHIEEEVVDQPKYTIDNKYIVCTVEDAVGFQNLINLHLEDVSQQVEASATTSGAEAAERGYRVYRAKPSSDTDSSDAFLQALEKAYAPTLLSGPRITMSSASEQAIRFEILDGESQEVPILSDAVRRELSTGLIADVTSYPAVEPTRPSVLSQWRDASMIFPQIKIVLRNNIDMDGNPFGGFGGGGFGGGGFGGGGLGSGSPMYREVDVDGDGTPEKVPFYPTFRAAPPEDAGAPPAPGTRPGARVSILPRSDQEWSGLWQAVAIEPDENDEDCLYIGIYAVLRQKREETKGHLFWRKTTLDFAETAWRAELDFDLTRQPLFLIGKGAWPDEYQIIKVSVLRPDGGQGKRFFRIDDYE